MSDPPETRHAPDDADRPEPLLSARNLARVYRVGAQTVDALRGVNLDIHAGDFIAIAGPSGSGKSTLLHLLGLIDSPTGGELRVRGRPAHALGLERRASLRLRTLGFVFQAFNLLQMLTARQNVEIALALAGVGRSERRDRARRLLESVGLGQRLNHRPVQLSGGERQRVAIARALANNPDIVLADEPTGNLDSATGRDIMQLLTDLNRSGATIILVTHDADIAAYSQRTIYLRDGQITRDERIAGYAPAGPMATGPLAASGPLPAAGGRPA